MVLDIILAAIIVFSMVFGFRKGFVYTFVHTLGWIGATIGAFFLLPYAKSFLNDNTGMRDSIHGSLKERFSLGTDPVTDSVDSLPRLVGGSIHSAAEGTADLLASNLSNLIMTILCYALVLVLIKVLFFLLTMLISKKENRGFIGFFDGLLGLVAGALKGVVIGFLLLALLLPAVNLIKPDQSSWILTTMESSHFARTLYDSNFIVLIVNDFFD